MSHNVNQAPRSSWAQKPRSNYSTSPDIKVLLVSPEAYDGLRAMSSSWGLSSKRIHTLLELLPSEPSLYIDRRPQDWKDQDLAMLEQGHFPLWSYEYQRMGHNVIIAPSTMAKLVAIARHHNIVQPFHKSKWDHPMSRVNALLEALGLGLLAVHVTR